MHPPRAIVARTPAARARRRPDEPRSGLLAPSPMPAWCSTTGPPRARLTAGSERDRRPAACRLGAPAPTSGPGPMPCRTHQPRVRSQASTLKPRAGPGDDGGRTLHSTNPTLPDPRRRRPVPAHRPAAGGRQPPNEAQSQSHHRARAGPGATPRPRSPATRTHWVRQRRSPQMATVSPCQGRRSEKRLRQRAVPWRKLPRCRRCRSARVSQTCSGQEKD